MAGNKAVIASDSWISSQQDPAILQKYLKDIDELNKQYPAYNSGTATANVHENYRINKAKRQIQKQIEQLQKANEAKNYEAAQQLEQNRIEGKQNPIGVTNADQMLEYNKNQGEYLYKQLMQIVEMPDEVAQEQQMKVFVEQVEAMPGMVEILRKIHKDKNK